MMNLTGLFMLAGLMMALEYVYADDAADPMAFIKSHELKHTTANGINLAYKTIGDEADPPVLMIMGLGATHITWGDQVIKGMVDKGYRVIIFDNRDVGASQHLDELGEPWLIWEYIKSQLGFEIDAGYTLEDMAADSVGLLDALGIEQAHVVGASMGGMIAQIVAGRYPDRVITLTSIMSSSGAEHLPEGGGDDDGGIGDIAGEPSAELEEFGIYPESMPRQIMATFKTGDRTPMLKTITTPTLVIHGARDNILPLPHGEHTAEVIAGSTLIVYEDMGHNFPDQLVPEILGEMASHMQGQAQDQG